MSTLTKQIDDTSLEYYGLTKQDLEKIKNEVDDLGDTNIDEMLLASKIREMFYLRFGIDVDLDDIIFLLRKNKVFNKQKLTNEVV